MSLNVMGEGSALKLGSDAGAASRAIEVRARTAPVARRPSRAGVSGVQAAKSLVRFVFAVESDDPSFEERLQAVLAQVKARMVASLQVEDIGRPVLDSHGCGYHLALSELQISQELDALRCRYEALTPRQKQVMSLVASGLPNKQVAAELGRSEVTVKAHRGKAMRKMKARSFADLVRMAARLDLPLVARR